MLKKLLVGLILAVFLAGAVAVPLSATSVVDDHITVGGVRYTPEDATEEGGEWIPYVTDFAFVTDSFITASDEFSAALPENVNSGDGMAFYSQGHWFNYNLSGSKMQWTDAEGSKTKSIGAIQSSTGIADSNKVTYADAFSATAVEFYARRYGLREHFVLGSLPYNDGKIENSYLEYTGELSWDEGLSVWVDDVEYPGKTFTTSSRIEFRDTTGRCIFYLPPPFAYDSDSTPSYHEAVYDVKVSADKVQYGLRVPYSWLENAVFPVTIDPGTKVDLSQTETCSEYFARRLKEGWKVIDQDGYNVTLLSPSGLTIELDLRHDVDTLRPNAPGDKTEMPFQIPDSGAHWDKVDDTGTGDGLSTYLKTDEEKPDWDEDLYHITAPTGSGLITFVRVLVRFRRSHEVSPEAYAKPILETNSVEYQGDQLHLDTDAGLGWYLHSHQWNINPNTLEAWTWAQLGPLQAGMSLTGDPNNVYCTQVYVEVGHIPTGGLGVVSKGTAAVSTTGTVTPGYPADPAENDIIYLLVISNQYNGIGVINTPAGFTQAAQGTYQNSALSDRGRAALFWKRAAGTESGTVSVTRTGDTGTDTCFYAQMYLVLNSMTSGNPYDAITARYGPGSETVYWNAVTVSGSGRTLLAFAVQADNYPNIGDIASYTDMVFFDETTDGTDAQLNLQAHANVSADGQVSCSGGEVGGWATFHVSARPIVVTPTVTTQAASSIEDTTATGNGNITATGGENCTRRGFCYMVGISGDPTTANSVAYDDGSFGTGAYTKGITGLSTGSSYRVRAYAINSAGTGYGTTVQILTKPAAPTNVAATDGDHEDKVTITWTKSTGATNYHVWRGVVDLGAAGDVATFDDSGATAATITNAGTVTASDGTSTAHVTLSLAGEATGTTSHTYKVVASNATGNSDDSTTDNGYRGVGAITYQWQRSAADSDASYSNISGATTDPYNDTAAPAGVVTPGAATASDGTSADHVTLSLAGESVADGAGRYYQCIVSASGASNSPQTSNNNRGYRTTGGITYQWQRSAADSDENFSPIGGATTDPYNDVGAPENGDGRWYYCEVSATGTTTQDSTHNRGYRIVLPTVTTQAVTDIEDTTATGNGNIVDTANGNCSAWGICWNTTGNPDTGDNAVAGSGDGGTGAFTASLINLPTGTTIHTKAYATNLAGTGYGAEEDFLTKPAAPTNVAATDGDHTDKVVVTWTKSTGATGYKVYEGINLLDTLGDVATFDDTAAPAGTITNAGSVTASDGTSTAHVTLSLAGESTANGASRTYKVVALNATGDSDDSDTDTGYRSVGSITYQWQRSAADSDAAYGNIGGATTDPYNDTGAPAGVVTPGVATAEDGSSTAHVTLSLAGESVVDGEGRYYQCIVSSVDASNSPQTSDSNRGYRTTGALTYQWQRSAGDSDASYSNIGGATTDPYNDTDAPAGVITAGSTVATDGDSTAHVSLSLDGTSVADGAGRYFRCVLSATGTTSQNSTTDRGYRTTGALTYQWKRSAADSDASYSNIDGATNSTYDDTASPAPTITPGSTVATDGTETAHVALSLAGTSANNGDGRYFVCVLNATGTTEQTSATNRGYIGIGDLTYQWQRSSGIGDEDYSNIDGATTSPFNDTAAPAGSITNAGVVTASVTNDSYVTLSLASEATVDGVVRYFKCILNATGATQQISASNDGYRGVGAITYQWQRSAGDSDASYSNIGGGTTDPFNDAAAPAGTITPGIATASDGIAEAYVTLVVTGHSAAPGAGRYFQCILSSVDASNSPATSNADRGYRTVGAITYQWQRSDADSDAAYNTNIGTTNPYNDINAPSDGSGRWFRALLDATGAAQAETTHNRGYRASSGYEQLTEGDDADGDDIYGVNWAAQQFTAGSVSHTVTSVRVKIKRILSPGTITLSLRKANEIDEPVGADLASATLDGDTISTDATWYEFAISGISLEAGEPYALVMRAPAGDATNYVAWRWDSGGGLAEAVASLSTDAGITWTVDAGGADYLFEIRGDSLIELVGAQVFSDYIETGDWLIALTYKNEYVPYYPNENPANYFHLQLLDGIVVKTQVNCLMWGYRPGSIYLAPGIARTLEWGATDYTIRLYGSFGTNPASEYLLVAVDWRGANLSLLDSWVISQAKSIGADMSVTLVESIADLGEVLNEQGHTMFSIGIPELNIVRPELFAMVTRQPDYEESEFTHGLQGEADWETRLGPQVVEILTDAGDLVGVDGAAAGGFLFALGFIGVFALMSLFGHPVIGLSLGYPVLLTGAWYGVISWILIGVITFLAAVIFVYRVFLVR